MNVTNLSRLAAAPLRGHFGSLLTITTTKLPMLKLSQPSTACLAQSGVRRLLSNLKAIVKKRCLFLSRYFLRCLLPGPHFGAYGGGCSAPPKLPAKEGSVRVKSCGLFQRADWNRNPFQSL